MQITIDIPDEYAQRLTPQLPEISRRVLETVVAEAYKARHLTREEVGQILNVETAEIDAVLEFDAQALELPTVGGSREELLTGLAIALFQQKVLLIEQAADLIPLGLDDFYQLLIDRKILTPPNNPDDTPDELVLANLRLSLQDIQAGRTVPLDELWDGIDD